jgi:hypothetical protein
MGAENDSSCNLAIRTYVAKRGVKRCTKIVCVACTDDRTKVSNINSIFFEAGVICYLLSVICYLLSVICYLLSVICYLLSVINAGIGNYLSERLKATDVVPKRLQLFYNPKNTYYSVVFVLGYKLSEKSLKNNELKKFFKPAFLTALEGFDVAVRGQVKFLLDA